MNWFCAACRDNREACDDGYKDLMPGVGVEAAPDDLEAAYGMTVKRSNGQPEHQDQGSIPPSRAVARPLASSSRAVADAVAASVEAGMVGDQPSDQLVAEKGEDSRSANDKATDQSVASVEVGLGSDQSREVQQGSTAAGGMDYQPNAIPVGEARLCPISGLSTLQGMCPFAKPKKKAKSGDKPPKLQLQLDLLWEQGASKVSISVRPHKMDAWAALELSDTASKEQIRKQYRKLMLIHHPDKNLDNTEEATKRFEQIKAANEALKDTDGELGFPWDEHKDKQQTMTGEEAILQFGKFGLEACEQQPLEALQLRHMVKCATDVKALLFNLDSQDADGSTKECWLDALCVDNKSGADHVVKIYRRLVDENEEETPMPE